MLPFKLRLLKRFDRHVGRWLCHNLRPTPRAALDRPADAPPWGSAAVPADQVRSILLIRPGGIGDAVLTYPMLNVLHQYFAGARIDVLVEGRNAGVYRINQLVREIFRYDRHPFGTLRKLAAQRYDLIVDSEQYHHLSAVIANHLAPRYLCGFDTLGRGRFMTHRVHYTEQCYEVYSFLNLAAALLGRPVPFDVNVPFLDVDPKWLHWADEALAARDGRPLAVLMPAASSEHRFWAPQRYAEVTRWLVARGFYCVALGGQDAVGAGRQMTHGCAARDVLDLTGRTSIAQSAGLIARAGLYVSADTGALHIAYGVGTPTVHMFGSGIQAKWAPLGQRYQLVHKGLPCSPCTRYGYTPPCPYGVACMDAIRVADVTAAIEEVLRS